MTTVPGPGGSCSANSSPSVPWPATTRGSSKACTNVAPVDSTWSRAAATASSNPSPPRTTDAPYPRAASTFAIGAPAGTKIVASIPARRGGPRDGLPVVPGARGHDSLPALLVTQLHDRVVGAADLERARQLEVLGLERHLAPGQPADRPGREDGRHPRHARQPLARGLEVGEARPAHETPSPSTRRDDPVDGGERVELAPLDGGDELGDLGIGGDGLLDPRPHAGRRGRDDLPAKVPAPPFVELSGGGAGVPDLDERAPQVGDTLASQRLGQDDRWALRRRCERQHSADVGQHRLRAGLVHLVDRDHVRDLHDPRLERLDRVARAGHQHEHHLVGDAEDLHLALTCAHGLEEDDVLACGVEEQQALQRGLGEAARVPTGAHGADEDIGVEEVAGESDPVAEKSSLREGARGVDGDDPDGEAERADMPQEGTDQRRLPDSGRPGEADRERGPGLRVELLGPAPEPPARGSRPCEIARARALPSPARTPATSCSCVQVRRAIRATLRHLVRRLTTFHGKASLRDAALRMLSHRSEASGTESLSDSRHTSAGAVGSTPMLGQFTAQFAIVGLPEHGAYRRLLLARLISALGTWTAFFAVRIALYQQTSSAWWVSVLLFCELVPGVILGIAVGPLIDRWNRKWMMFCSDLGGALTFAVLPFVHSPAGICALSAVAGFSAAFFRPGCYSAIPNLVRRESLVAANALVQGSENLATLLGPVLAGVGVVLLGSGAVYALNSVSFLVSALLILRIGTRLQSNVPARIGRTHWREVRAGLSLVRNDHHLSSIFLIWSWATLAYTGINVAEIVLTTEAYGAGNPGFGVFVACSAAGILIGNVVAVWFIDRLSVYGGYRASFLVTAAGVAVCAVSPGLVDRVHRRRRVRDRQRHRPRLQRDPDPAGRLRRPARPDLRGAREPRADVHARRDARSRPDHRGRRPPPDVGHQRRAPDRGIPERRPRLGRAPHPRTAAADWSRSRRAAKPRAPRSSAPRRCSTRSSGPGARGGLRAIAPAGSRRRRRPVSRWCARTRAAGSPRG